MAGEVEQDTGLLEAAILMVYMRPGLPGSFRVFFGAVAVASHLKL